MNECEYRKDPAIFYFTGYSPEHCMLAYDPESGKKALFVTSFEIGNYKGIRNFGFEEGKIKEKILKFFGFENIDVIGVNKTCLSVHKYTMLKKIFGCRIKDVSDKVSMFRMIKTFDEIEKIKKACSISYSIFNEFIKQLKSKPVNFRVERDIWDFISKKMFMKGVKPAFETIVATGKNSAEPHHISDSSVLNGFIVIDMGVKYNGYCSDMTRTIYFGKPSVDEIKYYDKVIRMYDSAFLSLHSDVSFFDVDKVARKIGGKRFKHGLGHGLGVEIHEKPYLSPKSKDSLKEGMVFTVEPGIYIKGKYGIRHENTVVFSKGKLKELTGKDKELIVVR